MVVLQAMGRIFVGLCQVGAWGCFDEFNRLEERMLSACSQQIQTIQEALKEHASKDAKDKGWFLVILACIGVSTLQRATHMTGLCSFDLSSVAMFLVTI